MGSIKSVFFDDNMVSNLRKVQDVYVVAGTFVTLTGQDLLLYEQFDVEVGTTKCMVISL